MSRPAMADGSVPPRDDACPVAADSSLEAVRSAAIDDIIGIFEGSDPARILRHVAHAAFMRDAWAGRIFDTSAIMSLGERDHAEVMALTSPKAVRSEAHE